MTVPGHCGAFLTIDLDAIAGNYRMLKEKVGNAACAAVVKANAYGLGVSKVAPALAGAGCKDFFVATIDEGIELRGILNEVSIYVFNGIEPGSGQVFAEHRLTPVLNTLGDIETWTAFCAEHGSPLPANLHVDTGMSRLGLEPQDIDTLEAEPQRLDGMELVCIMSHLACADEPDNTINSQQLKAFRRTLERLPPAASSLANSPGIFLGPDYHFDMVRPGAALYGLSPLPNDTNPMAQVISLQGKILQTRDVDTPMTVGYGATHKVGRKGRIATVAVGYADGYPRSLSNTGRGYIGNYRVPIVGCVSMDLITLDVTAIPRNSALPGTVVNLIGPHNTVDEIARLAGTIGYEILTGLGMRLPRIYTGVGA